MAIDSSAHATDGTTRTWLRVDGAEYPLVSEYSYTNDVIALVDTGCVNLANPDGQDSGKFGPGSTVELYMADPAVNGGASIRRVLGIVTNARMLSKGGEKLQVQFSDIGWHLAENDMGLWISLSGIASLAALIEKCLRGPKGARLNWGFENPDGSLRYTFSNTDRSAMTKINQGRAGIERSILYKANTQQDPKAFVPPIQSDVGAKIGQTLINYARRAGLLVNILSDGTLSFFSPNYQQGPSYSLRYYGSRDARRSGPNGNNIIDESIVIDNAIDGLYSDVSCVTSRVYSLKAKTNENPNADKIRGRAQAINNLPNGIYRQATFSDGDMIGQDAATLRALIYVHRGQYDSWTYTCEVSGHQQGGLFWEPNTIVAIDDPVHKVIGNYYLQAVTPMRSLSGGTRCRLVIKKAGLLSADFPT